MKHVHHTQTIFFGTWTLVVAITVFLSGLTALAQQPESLMTAIMGWRYPDAKIHKSTMQDASTVNENGQRTDQSIQYKTVMTTTDALSKVFDYYKEKLAPLPIEKTERVLSGEVRGIGRSVTFHEDSDGRPLAVRIINVNTAQSATTLVISRGTQESETHIAWTRYVRF